MLRIPIVAFEEMSGQTGERMSGDDFRFLLESYKE